MVTPPRSTSSDLSGAHTELPSGTVRHTHLQRSHANCKTCPAKWDGDAATRDGIAHASRTGHPVASREWAFSYFVSEKEVPEPDPFSLDALRELYRDIQSMATLEQVSGMDREALTALLPGIITAAAELETAAGTR